MAAQALRREKGEKDKLQQGFRESLEREERGAFWRERERRRCMCWGCSERDVVSREHGHSRAAHLRGLFDNRFGIVIKTYSSTCPCTSNSASAEARNWAASSGVSRSCSTLRTPRRPNTTGTLRKQSPSIPNMPRTFTATVSTRSSSRTMVRTMQADVSQRAMKMSDYATSSYQSFPLQHLWRVAHIILMCK